MFTLPFKDYFANVRPNVGDGIVTTECQFNDYTVKIAAFKQTTVNHVCYLLAQQPGDKRTCLDIIFQESFGKLHGQFSLDHFKLIEIC